MSEPVDQLPTHPLSRTICEHSRVRLEGGWTGLAMTGCAGGDSGCEPDTMWPTTSQWVEWLNNLVRSPESMPGYEVLKHSAKGEVFRTRIELPGRNIDVVCKRGSIRGIGRRIVHLFRKSRARTQFDKALGLLRIGVRTPLPLARIERGFGRANAWLVTAFVRGAVDLDRIALSLLSRVPASRQRIVRDEIIDALAALFDRIEMHGLDHRDLKASNVMISAWDQGPDAARIWLVDLEGVRLKGHANESLAWQSIVRLTASLINYPSIARSDYCRFLHAFLPRLGISPTHWGERFQFVAEAARRYNEQAKRRKTRKLDGYADGV